MELNLRNETPADYRTVEELTRDAFWGSMDHPTCDGEHLIVHRLRQLPTFVPELDVVAEHDGRIVGHVIYSRANIVTPQGERVEVLTFGPLSVLPAYKRQGVGSALMQYTLGRAAALGWRAVVVYGHPDYYPRFGFRRGAQYGITAADGSSFDALMALELYEGALRGISGRFVEDPVFAVDPAQLAAFEKTFPPKAPVQLPPLALLVGYLPAAALARLQAQGLCTVSALQRWSGAELLTLPDMDADALARLNERLAQLGQPPKSLPVAP